MPDISYNRTVFQAAITQGAPGQIDLVTAQPGCRIWVTSIFVAAGSAGSADSLKGSGTAAAPGVGASFATLGSLPAAGRYQVDWQYVISGAAEPQALNVGIKLNGATFLAVPDSAGVTGIYSGSIPSVTLDGTNTPSLIAVAAATVSTVYTGFLVVTKIDTAPAATVAFNEGVGPTALTGAIPLVAGVPLELATGAGSGMVLATNTANSKLGLVSTTLPVFGWIRYFIAA